MRPRTQDGGGRGVGIRTGGGPNPACAYRRGRDGPGIQDPAARRTWSPVRPHAPSFSPNFLLATSYRSYLISLQRLYTAQSCGTAHSSCLVPLVLLNHDPTSPSACPSLHSPTQCDRNAPLPCAGASWPSATRTSSSLSLTPMTGLARPDRDQLV